MIQLGQPQLAILPQAASELPLLKASKPIVAINTTTATATGIAITIATATVNTTTAGITTTIRIADRAFVMLMNH